VAKLIPGDDRGYEVFGCLAGDLDIVGDLDASVVSPSTLKDSR
jgi:hypothetical protein